MPSDFKNALKQRLWPQFSPAMSSSPASLNTIQPRAAFAPDQISASETARTGGAQMVEDIMQEYWFSALQPVQPVAPVSYRPRQRAFLPGENIIWTPGEDKGGVSFDMLRAMADGWDLLRLVIETRKDQLGRLKWEIRAKPEPGETFKDRKDRQLKDVNIQKLTDFFNYPDGHHPWKAWLRMWMEDNLVLDAAALYLQRDQKGRVASVIPIDGATIMRCITDLGITPTPPSVAYQQVVYGTPACDLTTDDLLYAMRNERTHRRYGYSPVEQMLVTISIGLRKQDFLLKYYTDGNIPESLCFLPSNITVTRIKEIQDWFDSVLAGDLQRRRRMTFLPGFGTGMGNTNVASNVVFPKEPLLKDELDEWLLRIVCYAFSVSPQNLMKQMNRASAEQASDTAEEEGLEPTMSFIAGVCNRIIKAFGLDEEYEFGWKETRTVDELKQAQVDNLLIGKVYSINEIREMRGDDPRPEAEASMLGVFGATGFIPIEQQPQQFEQQQTMAQNQDDRDQEQHEQQMSQPQVMGAGSSGLGGAPSIAGQAPTGQLKAPVMPQKLAVVQRNGKLQRTLIKRYSADSAPMRVISEFSQQLVKHD